MVSMVFQGYFIGFHGIWMLSWSWWWLLFLELQNKGSIWHLFTHGEYFQPQRALFKHWIQTGFLQKKKTTEDNQLSLSRPKLDPVTPSSIWHQAPPCWINSATSSGWSWRWCSTTRKFPSEIFGCGKNGWQSSEILNDIAPITFMS